MEEFNMKKWLTNPKNNLQTAKRQIQNKFGNLITCQNFKVKVNYGPKLPIMTQILIF